jgi:excisionase family DNA binding protein
MLLPTKTIGEEDELLTIDQVAHRLGITTKTVRAHMRSGRLRYAKVGRRVRFTGAWLREFVEACEVKAG